MFAHFCPQLLVHTCMEYALARVAVACHLSATVSWVARYYSFYLHEEETWTTDQPGPGAAGEHRNYSTPPR